MTMYNDNFCENPKKYSEEEHKSLLTALFSDNKPSEFDINEVHNLVKYFWRFQSWYYDFIIELLKTKKTTNKTLIISITSILSVKNKDEFIAILKNIQFHLNTFFYINFHKFEYTELDINFIKSLFGYETHLLHPDYFDYAQKRDIFDYFGIIPCLLKPKSTSFEESDWRFFFRHFKNLTIEDQTKLIIYSFSYVYTQQQYDFESENYENFVYLFLKENLNVVDFISQKNNINILEDKFLIDARPIVEKINIDLNIKDF